MTNYIKVVKQVDEKLFLQLRDIPYSDKHVHNDVIFVPEAWYKKNKEKLELNETSLGFAKFEDYMTEISSYNNHKMKVKLIQDISNNNNLTKLQARNIVDHIILPQLEANETNH